MNDLSDKFGALEQLLASQLVQILNALAGLGTKLDAIATALGAPPPTETVTLADIKTVLESIHLDTQSQDLKLLRIRDAIWPLDDPPFTTSRSSMRWSLYRLFLGMDGQDVTSPLMPVRQATYSTYDLLNTFLRPNFLLANGLLGNISENTKCCCTKQPDPADPGGCASPLQSSSSVLFEGRSYAAWSSVTPPLSLGSTLGLPSGVQLHVSDTWDGWRIYVQSDVGGYQEAPGRQELFPCNEWRALADTGDLAISVSGESIIKVYLCSPPVPQVDCVTLETRLVTVTTTDPPYFHQRYAAEFPVGFDVTDFFPFSPFFTYSPASIAVGAWTGWSVDLQQGLYARVVMSGNAGFVGTFVLTPENSVITIPSGQFLCIDNWQNNESVGEPFTIRLCPPGPA